MPIYEYRCPHCRILYSVYARTVNPRGTLYCPQCPNAVLSRQVSVFSAPRPAGSEAVDRPAGADGGDPARMEDALRHLAGEVDQVGENNPRDAARLLRRLSTEAGMPIGPGLNEALARLAAGEDPEQVEADLGDVLDRDPQADGDEPVDRSGARRKLPFRDPNLYDWADLEKRNTPA